jgi:hypothetical protein
MNIMLQNTEFLNKLLKFYLKAFRITMNSVKTQQFIPLFSTAYFGLRGHHQVEHKIKRIYTRTQFIWNWDLKT